MKAYFSYINARKGAGRQARHLRPPDRLQRLRRRLQPGADRAADAQARRAGQGLRGRRLARHRAQRGDPAVPERTARCRRSSTRPAPRRGARTAKQYPWTGGWQPDYEYEARIYGTGDRPQQPEREDRRALPERQLRRRTTCAVSRRGSAPRRRTSSARSRYEVTAADVRSQVAKLRGDGCDVFVIFATPRFTVQAYAIANALRLVARRDLHDLGLGDGHVPDARQELGRRRPPRPHVHASSTPRIRRARRGTTTPAMKLYKQVMAKYYPSGRATDGLNSTASPSRTRSCSSCTRRGRTRPGPR